MIDIHTEKLLTIRQVQDETKLSHITIQRSIASKKIKAESINDVWFIPRSELPKLPKPRKPRGIPASEHEQSHVESTGSQENPFLLEQYKAETERMKVEAVREAMRWLLNPT